jgi:glucose/mannose-6-phosphate isomerase
VTIAEAARLDDTAALAEADKGDMLRQVASAAAYLRQATLISTEAGVPRLAEDGRPRAIVVAGMGVSGTAGDALAAVCGPSCPVPIVTVRGYRLPGWVGAADVVLAGSATGADRETLALAGAAVRRGARLVCVGAPGSPLADVAAQGRALFVPIPLLGPPRALLWALLAPMIQAVRSLRLLDVPDDVFETTAARLEEVSHRCRPASESFLNPGKQLALDLAEALPMIWGSTPLAGVAAYRFAAQLAVNAKRPALHGELPEAGHDQLMLLEGAVTEAGDPDDFFRDRADDVETALHLVLLHDPGETAELTAHREASLRLAESRGVPVTEVPAEGDHPLERLAAMIALTDYASVYLALALGVDPTPTAAAQELSTRIGWTQ